ncbi:hypothetical protein SAMN05428944_0115 [Streptomyces sp. 1222.5]|nr:hypothetical protein BX260_0112 [Streptomyces sp. 5112.2]SEB53837.1 hypothetical protein SAMN05428944_0115 [Streptomyces sp. 1222.5]SEC02519.1 hypothetical protein SAMN05216532_0232 [Streptomyces sp. 2231.1]
MRSWGPNGRERTPLTTLRLKGHALAHAFIPQREASRRNVRSCAKYEAPSR